jgi:hypothetical protein
MAVARSRLIAPTKRPTSLDNMQPFTFFVIYRRQDTASIVLLLKHEIENRLQFVHMQLRLVIDGVIDLAGSV